MVCIRDSDFRHGQKVSTEGFGPSSQRESKVFWCAKRPTLPRKHSGECSRRHREPGPDRLPTSSSHPETPLALLLARDPERTWDRRTHGDEALERSVRPGASLQETDGATRESSRPTTPTRADRSEAAGSLAWGERMRVRLRRGNPRVCPSARNDGGDAGHRDDCSPGWGHCRGEGGASEEGGGGGERFRACDVAQPSASGQRSASSVPCGRATSREGDRRGQEAPREGSDTRGPALSRRQRFCSTSVLAGATCRSAPATDGLAPSSLLAREEKQKQALPEIKIISSVRPRRSTREHRVNLPTSSRVGDRSAAGPFRHTGIRYSIFVCSGGVVSMCRGINHLHHLLLRRERRGRTRKTACNPGLQQPIVTLVGRLLSPRPSLSTWNSSGKRSAVVAARASAFFKAGVHSPIGLTTAMKAKAKIMTSALPTGAGSRPREGGRGLGTGLLLLPRGASRLVLPRAGSTSR